jgi:hypothetical protein
VKINDYIKNTMPIMTNKKSMKIITSKANISVKFNANVQNKYTLGNPGNSLSKYVAI